MMQYILRVLYKSYIDVITPSAASSLLGPSSTVTTTALPLPLVGVLLAAALQLLSLLMLLLLLELLELLGMLMLLATLLLCRVGRVLQACCDAPAWLGSCSAAWSASFRLQSVKCSPSLCCMCCRCTWSACQLG
jgi:hypothetical protein